MKTSTPLVLVAAATALAVAATMTPMKRSQAATTCPDTSVGETQEDCPWAGVARALEAQAGSGGQKAVVNLLRQLLPDLDRSLQADAHRPAWKSLWGRSINFDELAKGIIVHPVIVAALAQRFGNRAPLILTHFREEKFETDPQIRALSQPVVTDPAGHPLVHAGLQHTYGYLFSLLKTPYGYKRARWVQGEIEQGFGLKPGLLGPRPESGTLFANVTYFAGHIAFRDNPALLETLRKGSADVPSALREFDFSKLEPTRVEETVQAKDALEETRTVVLRTDFVSFFHSQKDTHLLVYSVLDPSDGGEHLISAFPVNQAAVDAATRSGDLGENKPVQTRYNAFVEGVTGVKLKGTRKVTR